MRQLLQVQPLLAVQKTVQRFEGYLLKVSSIIILSIDMILYKLSALNELMLIFVFALLNLLKI